MEEVFACSMQKQGSRMPLITEELTGEVFACSMQKQGSRMPLITEELVA
jgi:hypothetical protein